LAAALAVAAAEAAAEEDEERWRKEGGRLSSGTELAAGSSMSTP
jgi:hypothetical protein